MDGDLKAVNAMIEKESIKNILAVTGLDKTSIVEGKPIFINNWNPLLVALNYNQSELVKYFIGNRHLSLRVAGRSP